MRRRLAWIHIPDVFIILPRFGRPRRSRDLRMVQSASMQTYNGYKRVKHTAEVGYHRNRHIVPQQ
jgi:hypothetical protein